jgi:hypothetical protein
MWSIFRRSSMAHAGFIYRVLQIADAHLHLHEDTLFLRLISIVRYLESPPPPPRPPSSEIFCSTDSDIKRSGRSVGLSK